MARVPLIDFIISKNLHCRHLNESQIAVCMDEFLPFYEEEARERKKETLKLYGRGKMSQKIDSSFDRNNGKAAAHLVKASGTNRQYISDAKKIRKENPRYIEKIKSGELTIPQAKKQIKREKIFKQAENY